MPKKIGMVWKLRKMLIIAVCTLDHIKRTSTQGENGYSAIVQGGSMRIVQMKKILMLMEHCVTYVEHNTIKILISVIIIILLSFV